MKRTPSTKTGFTIIEIALFLALSGFLMVGLIMGANVSISRQRYNDSVNSFAEFVRGTYADALNVSNDKDPNVATDQAGRTTTAVYGKLISIGEDDKDTVYVYDLVGNAVNSSAVKSSRIINMMFETNNGSATIGANIFSNDCSVNPVGCTNTFYRDTSYEIPWSGTLSRGMDAGASNNGSRFKGAILIIRSPVTGNIRTYTFDYNKNATKQAISNAHIDTNFHSQTSNPQARTNFKTYLETLADTSIDNGGENSLLVCVDSDDNTDGNRRGVRIAARATNSSGVMLTEMNAENADCEGRTTF